jgi:enoyl-CoA hydratase/carnithine racemase
VTDAVRTLDTGTPEVLCRIERRVGVVTLNRPDAKNALSMDMKRALHRVIPELGANPDVGCLLLTGAGFAFCAGGDTKRMASEGRPPSPEDRKRQLRWEHEVPRALHRLEKPTVAALPGPAAGAGFALALACDLRLMAEAAFATTAYARLGLSGDYGASWFLTRLLGPALAREVMFLGERLSSADCARLGLANRVLPDAGFDAAALEYAARIAAGPPIALRYMKDNLNRALTDTLESVLDIESERMVQGAGTEDYEEAVKAFAEKRTPVFKGR